MTGTGAGSGADRIGGRDEHSAFDELAVGWALDALEPEEEAAFQIHLARCERCLALVVETSETAADLAQLAPDAEPSEGLRARILEAARGQRTGGYGDGDIGADVGVTPSDDRGIASATPLPARAGTPPRAGGRHAAGPEDSTPARAATTGGATVVPMRRRNRMGAALLSAAAAVAIVALALWNVSLRNDRNDARTTALREGSTISAIAQPGSQVAILATGNGTHVGAVVGTDAHWKVVAAKMPKNNTRSTTYVLWGLQTKDATPQALGTFDVTSGATSVADVHSKASTTAPPKFGLYAVSFEQGRTAPAAPSTVMATGQTAS